jgi:hypothetical protein
MARTAPERYPLSALQNFEETRVSKVHMTTSGMVLGQDPCQFEGESHINAVELRYVSEMPDWLKAKMNGRQMARLTNLERESKCDVTVSVAGKRLVWKNVYVLARIEKGKL